MAVFKIIGFKELDKRTYRIDSEYHHPDYFTMERRLYERGARPFYSYYPEIIHPGEIIRRYSENGIWFLRAQNVRPLQINKDNSVYLPPITLQILSKNKLQKKDILITRTGANFGQCAVYLYDEDAIASSHTLIIRVLQIDTCFLAVYFNTSYGRKFIDRGMYGAAQPEIAPYFIKQILIPNNSQAFQGIIREKYLKSHSLLRKSTEFYTQAEQLLLSELGLQDWKPARALTFVRSYSQAAKAGRMDAEYFQPKFDDILRRLSLYPLQRLSKVASQITDTVTFSESQKYRYIEISDVNTANGEVGYTEREVKELPPNAKVKVKGGELIVSKVRPTRGAIGIIPDDCQDNGVCSSAFVVLNVPSPIKEFLQVYLRSIVGKTLLEQPCKGTSYPTIDDIDVLRLPIPIISTETQEKISALVIQSHVARREAKALLDKAKRAVEIAIEENEERAMEFIG